MRWLPLVVLFLLITSEAAAQAWIHAPGAGYSELSVRRVSGGAFYDSEGESHPIASQYTQTTLTAYGEVGVIERWLQLSAAGELYRRNALADQGATRGLGDLKVGAFTGLLQGRLNIAAGLMLGLPTGDDAPSSGTGDPQQDIIAASLPTGAGAFNLTPTLAVGIGFGGGFWPLEHYLSTSIGYLAWFGFTDSLVYSAELGSRLPISILDRLTLRLRLTGLEPLSKATVTSFSGVGEGVTFTSYGFGVAIAIWKGLGISATYESAFRARNIISATPMSVGLYWNF